MKVLSRGIACSFIFLIVYGYAAPIGAQTVKLDRIEVAIDFKEEGYYRSIPFIALDRDLFFITDNIAHRVLEYRFGGNKLEFLRAIGRPGQGPGDLRLPTNISISGGTLAVKDQSGISFFGPDGGFKNKFPLLSWAETMMFKEDEIYATSVDSAKADFIHVYSRNGESVRSFQDKTKLYPIRYDIISGLSPAQVQSYVCAGLLRDNGRSIYFLSKRFGNVLRFDPDGKATGSWEISHILGDNERAKAAENRRMFLEKGFDVEKIMRFIPQNYLFEDAQIADGRLYLLLENWDILEKKAKPVIEFVEIELDAWAVVRSYRADAQAKWESASQFIFIGDKTNPIFLTAVRSPDDDEKICIFKPEVNRN